MLSLAGSFTQDDCSRSKQCGSYKAYVINWLGQFSKFNPSVNKFVSKSSVPIIRCFGACYGLSSSERNLVPQEQTPFSIKCKLWLPTPEVLGPTI